MELSPGNILFPLPASSVIPHQIKKKKPTIWEFHSHLRPFLLHITPLPTRHPKEHQRRQLKSSFSPSVHGGQWVVQQIDVQVGVQRSRKVDPLALAAGQGHPTLTDLGQVALGQDLQLRKIFERRLFAGSVPVSAVIGNSSVIR